MSEDRPEDVVAESASSESPDATAVEDHTPEARGPQLVLAPEDIPDVSGLIIEDGAPVESIEVEKQYRLLTDALDSSWPGPGEGGPFIALTNVGLFYAVGRPPLVPDFLLTAGVDYPGDPSEKQYNSYFAWIIGRFPDVVVEIVSDHRGGEETHKMLDYARLRIPYYVIYDPRDILGNGILRVFELHRNKYHLAPDNWLPTLELGLTLWRGTYSFLERTWLRWCDRNGQVIPTGRERAELERQRAELERQRAEQERHRAEQAERLNAELAERIQRLEAELRAREGKPPT